MTSPSLSRADAAERAAAEELSLLFKRMEVPCEVSVTTQEGKHVKATKELPAGTVLFEEVPLVAWPASSFSLLQHRREMCFSCLKVCTKEDRGGQTSCRECGAAVCSVCREERPAAVVLHTLLCSGDIDGDSSEKTVPSTSSPSCLKASGMEAEEGVDSQPRAVTLESLARCAACLLHRLSCLLRQQQTALASLTTGEVEVLQSALFSAAAAPFNRLLGASDAATFTGVDSGAWVKGVRESLQTSGKGLLLAAAGTTRSPAVALMVDNLVAAALSDETLRTMLGQLAVNAHGILLEVPSQEGGHEKAVAAVKGGGLYSLISNLNHSCEPNVSISHPTGTFEAEVKVVRDVKAGEALTIAYICCENSREQRRAELRSTYFFECCCPKCEREKS